VPLDDPPASPSRRERRRADRRAARRFVLVVTTLITFFAALIVIAQLRADPPIAAAPPVAVIAPVAASRGGPSGGEAPASPEQVADIGYLALLDDEGVAYADRDETVGTGRRVCAFLHAGGTTTGASVLVIPRGRYSPADADAVVGAAVRAFCPDRRPDG
jgi:hypothetical protein